MADPLLFELMNGRGPRKSTPVAPVEKSDSDIAFDQVIKEEVDRLGLVALKTDKYPLAIHAFTHVIDLSPDFAGAYLYRAECFYHQVMPGEAHADLSNAKLILKTTGNEGWNEHLHEVEDLLTNS